MMFVKKSIRYVLAALTVVKSTLAIKYGDLDGEGHPHVGLMVALDINKNPLWRCTGTLISPTLFLTAGHCVDQPAASVTIWFDADNEIGMPQNGYPFKGEASSKSIHAHPEYNTDAFFLHDLGMVKLTKPVKRDYYGELPASGMLDELVSSYRDEGVSFTAVGYGLQFVGPLFLEANKIRYVTQPDLVQINTPAFTGDWSILVTNNAVSIEISGSVCFLGLSRA